MIVPVLLFPFFGIVVGLAILFKNESVMGDLANPDGMWYQFWTLIENGGWTVFKQMELLFVIGLPISLAKKAPGRAVLSAVVGYLMFNYFINGILTLWGPVFGVDFAAEVGGASGLKEIIGIKTLDTNIIGAILISGIVIWLHNRYYEKKLPESIGIFQGWTIRCYDFVRSNDTACFSYKLGMANGSKWDRIFTGLFSFFQLCWCLVIPFLRAHFNTDWITSFYLYTI